MNDSTSQSTGRTRSIRLSLNKDELGLVKGLAAKAGMPVAAWIRLVALGVIPQPKPKQIEQLKAELANTPEAYAAACARAYGGGDIAPVPIDMRKPMPYVAGDATAGSAEDEEISVEEFEKRMRPQHSDEA